MPLYAFRDRPLTPLEFEQLRLILSSYRDGTGQVVIKKTGETMPGFRDYERALADVLRGTCPEDKGVFDVEIAAKPDPFGISCKMSSMQPAISECSFMELSNSAAKFRNHLLALQVHWMSEPTLAGPEIVDLVTSWHYDLAGEIDVANSKYAILAHDRRWERFQILCFPLDLKIAKPKGDVEWLVEGASLNGYIDDNGRRHRLWQCFMNSGGQLKYYPLMRWADWTTDVFRLEQPPVVSPHEKAKKYFPKLWPS